MKRASDLIEMKAQLREFEIQIWDGLHGLVGTRFTCERNKIVIWEEDESVVSWSVTNYDSHREQFEVKGEGEEMIYYPNTTQLLNILKVIGE